MDEGTGDVKKNPSLSSSSSVGESSLSLPVTESVIDAAIASNNIKHVTEQIFSKDDALLNIIKKTNEKVQTQKQTRTQTEKETQTKKQTETKTKPQIQSQAKAKGGNGRNCYSNNTGARTSSTSITTTVSSLAVTPPITTTLDRQRGGYVQPKPGAYSITGPGVDFENSIIDAATTDLSLSTVTTPIEPEASYDINSTNELVSPSTTTTIATSTTFLTTNSDTLISAEIVDEEEVERLRNDLIAETEERVRKDFVMAQVVEEMIVDDAENNNNNNSSSTEERLPSSLGYYDKNKKRVIILSIFVLLIVVIVVIATTLVQLPTKLPTNYPTLQPTSSPTSNACGFYPPAACKVEMNVECSKSSNTFDDSNFNSTSCSDISSTYGCFDGPPKEMTFLYVGCACGEIYNGSSCIAESDTCYDSFDEDASTIMKTKEVQLEAVDSQTGSKLFLSSNKTCAESSFELTSPDGISPLPKSINITVREDDVDRRVLQVIIVKPAHCSDNSTGIEYAPGSMMWACQTLENTTLPNTIEIWYTGCTCQERFLVNDTNKCRGLSNVGFFSSHPHIQPFRPKQRSCKDYSYTPPDEIDIPAITEQHDEVRYEVTTTNEDMGSVLASGMISTGDNFTISSLFIKKNPFPTELNISIYEANIDHYANTGKILQSILVPSMCNASNPILLQGVEVNKASLQLIEIIDSNNKTINPEGRDNFITKHYGNSNGTRTISFEITIISGSEQQVNITSLVVNEFEVHPDQIKSKKHYVSPSDLDREEIYNGDIRWKYDFDSEEINMYNTILFTSSFFVLATDEDNNQCTTSDIEIMYLP